MSKGTQDEFVVWGMNRQCGRTPTYKGFTSSWDEVRRKYVEDNPTAVVIRMEVALPDKEAIAAGTTNAQLKDKYIAFGLRKDPNNV